MGHPERSAARIVYGHGLHPPRYQSKPWVIAMLVAALHQHLRTHTNAQKGPLCGRKPMNQVIKTPAAQFIHRIGKSAHAWQHQPVRKRSTQAVGLLNHSDLRAAML
jgi:hypothetical protein